VLSDGFEQRIQRLEERIRLVELTVLVWGPGDGGGEHYEKRLKLRQTLSAHFYKADIQFSEDLASAELPPGAPYLEPHQLEMWHLAACDICVVLDTSKGAGEEIAHFCASPLAHKLCILTSDRYRDIQSFPGGLRRRYNQHFYSDSEYAACNVVDWVVSQVRYLALGKLLQSGF
jgi:hypothetical protein